MAQKGVRTVSTKESKSVVRRMVEQSMIVGDIDAEVSAYARDFVYHNPVLATMPDLPTRPDGVWQLILATRAAFSDMSYAIEVLIAKEDKVAVLYPRRDTHRGNLGGISPPSRQVTATGAIVCRAAGGKIVG
jgi:predicted ester cyclase